jgi:hypothetical protein
MFTPYHALNLFIGDSGFMCPRIMDVSWQLIQNIPLARPRVSQVFD